MFERMKHFEARSDWFRLLMLREPRGHPQACVNLVVPPSDSRAVAGFIIMEQQRLYPGMSGTNTIIVATVLLETGLVPMREPLTELVLEAPAGLVRVRAHCSAGRVLRVDFENVPSFCTHLDVPIEVPGFGRVAVSVAFGGMAYALAEASQLGLEIDAAQGRALQNAALAVAAAANEKFGFAHPENPGFARIEGAVLYRRSPEGRLRQTTVTIAGQMDRTPAGTGCSAQLAVLHARGEQRVGEEIAIEGMFANPFHCRIVRESQVAGLPAIVPEIGGRAWITAYSQYVLRHDDPFPEGFVVGDIWPIANAASPAATLAARTR
jgi:proline racemase